MRLYIELQGCDDTTRFSLETDDPEPIRRLAALSRQASEYSCQPVMNVYDTGEDYETDWAAIKTPRTDPARTESGGLNDYNEDRP